VFEMLGFDVDWQGETQTAILTSANYEIRITIGSDIFTTNGTSHTLDVPAQNIGGRTMVPIRLPLESVGFDVGWDGESRIVLITSLVAADQIEPTPPTTQTGGLSEAERQTLLDINAAITELADASQAGADWRTSRQRAFNMSMTNLSGNLSPLRPYANAMWDSIVDAHDAYGRWLTALSRGEAGTIALRDTYLRYQRDANRAVNAYLDAVRRLLGA
jgi:hypothetical protein